MDNRYNKEYRHNKAVFYLNDHVPDVEESKFLIFKVMEQAVRDYISLQNAESTHELYLLQTATGFLFDDNYRLWWGKKELSPEDLLGIVDIDISWFRQRVKQKAKERKENDKTQKRRRSK